MVLSLQTKTIPPSSLGLLIPAIQADSTSIETDVNTATANIITNTADIATNVADIDVLEEERVTYDQIQEYVSQNEAGLYFDGINDVCSLSQVVPQLVQTWNTQGAILWTGRLMRAANQTLVCAADTAGTNEYIIMKALSTNKITCECRVAGTVAWSFTTTDAVITTGQKFSVMLQQDGTAPYLLVNREVVAITFTVSTNKTRWFAITTNVDNVTLMYDSINGAGSANFAQGIVNRCALFTQMPTLIEAKNICNGGEIPYKYKGANNTEHLTELNFATHVNWAVTGDWSDAGGNAAFTFAADATSTLVQAFGGMAVRAESGKQYCFKYVCAAAVAPDGTHNTFIANTFANAAVPLAVTAGTKYARFESNANAYTADFAIVTVVTGGTVGTYTYDDVSLFKVGCVMDLEAKDLGALQWKDNGGNAYVAAITGAVSFNLNTEKNQVVYWSSIGSDTNGVVVPAGYRLDAIIVKETANHALTGDLDIGTAGGGTQVVNSGVVGALAMVDLTLVAKAYSTTAAQTLYVSSSNWDTAVVNIWFVMSKFTV